MIWILIAGYARPLRPETNPEMQANPTPVSWTEEKHFLFGVMSLHDKSPQIWQFSTFAGLKTDRLHLVGLQPLQHYLSLS